MQDPKAPDTLTFILYKQEESRDMNQAIYSYYFCENFKTETNNYIVLQLVDSEVSRDSKMRFSLFIHYEDTININSKLTSYKLIVKTNSPARSHNIRVLYSLPEFENSSLYVNITGGNLAVTFNEKFSRIKKIEFIKTRSSLEAGSRSKNYKKTPQKHRDCNGVERTVYVKDGKKFTKRKSPKTNKFYFKKI